MSCHDTTVTVTCRKYHAGKNAKVRAQKEKDAAKIKRCQFAMLLALQRLARLMQFYFIFSLHNMFDDAPSIDVTTHPPS